MPHNLQNLSGFIKPSFVILRPVSDRRCILPHFATAESIDRIDNRINVVIFASLHIPADKCIRQTAMGEQDVIDSVEIGQLTLIRQGFPQNL